MTKPNETLMIYKLTYVILARGMWLKRIVEKLDFLEKKLIKRTVSLHVEGQYLPESSTGQLLVPITACRKDTDIPLRELKITDDQNRDLPIVSGKAVEQYLYSVVRNLLITSWKSENEISSECKQNIEKIITADCSDDERKQARGVVNEVLGNMNTLYRLEIDKLLDFLSSNTVIMVLVHNKYANLEFILHYSYCVDYGNSKDHSNASQPGNSTKKKETGFSQKLIFFMDHLKDWWRCILAAFAIRAYTVKIPLPDVFNAGSYHLEIPTPHGLITEQLKIPVPVNTNNPKSASQGRWRDDTKSSVSQVRSNYSDHDKPINSDRRKSGELHLIMDVLGNLPITVFIMSLLAFCIYYTLSIKSDEGIFGFNRPFAPLDIWTDYRDTESSNSSTDTESSNSSTERNVISAATSLLLFGAGTLLTLQGRQGESIYTRRIAAPLRAASFLLAIIFSLTATSLIGIFYMDYFRKCIAAVAIVSGIPAALFLIGRSFHYRIVHILLSVACLVIMLITFIDYFTNSRPLIIWILFCYTMVISVVTNWTILKTIWHIISKIVIFWREKPRQLDGRVNPKINTLHNEEGDQDDSVINIYHTERGVFPSLEPFFENSLSKQIEALVNFLNTQQYSKI